MPPATPGLTPTEILPHRDGDSKKLRIAWNNGSYYIVPYFDLRLHCPCAQCVDENTGKRVIQPQDIQAQIRPLELTPVGRYALKIRWSDHHETGMYSFDLLYHLCHEIGERWVGCKNN